VTNTNVIDLNSNIAARYLPGCIWEHNSHAELINKVQTRIH
jgi:hypothetical protein